jgi:hypothetical protein
MKKEGQARKEIFLNNYNAIYCLVHTPTYTHTRTHTHSRNLQAASCTDSNLHKFENQPGCVFLAPRIITLPTRNRTDH